MRDERQQAHRLDILGRAKDFRRVDGRNQQSPKL
jgi:hypothetical protein